jgi:hypothetical protein
MNLLDTWWASYLRGSASPHAALALTPMNPAVDIRHVLPILRIPTLVLHRLGDRVLHIEQGRHLAKAIPAARFVELPGDDHLPWVGDQSAILDEIQEFLTGVRPYPESDRMLATVIFTDVVGSTEHVAQFGDRAWQELLERYHTLVRKDFARIRGREVDTAGSPRRIVRPTQPREQNSMQGVACDRRRSGPE